MHSRNRMECSRLYVTEGNRTPCTSAVRPNNTRQLPHLGVPGGVVHQFGEGVPDAFGGVSGDRDGADRVHPHSPVDADATHRSAQDAFHHDRLGPAPAGACSGQHRDTVRQPARLRGAVVQLQQVTEDTFVASALPVSRLRPPSMTWLMTWLRGRERRFESRPRLERTHLRPAVRATGNVAGLGGRLTVTTADLTDPLVKVRGYRTPRASRPRTSRAGLLAPTLRCSRRRLLYRPMCSRVDSAQDRPRTRGGSSR
jgi:hypothetical protein